MQPVLDAAMDYLNMGFSVIPLAAGSKQPPKGFQLKKFFKQRADRDQLRDWFDNTEFNIGLVCGPISGGLMVRDFDTPEGFPNWRLANPQLAALLPTVKTPRGFHVYCRSTKNVSTQIYSDGELRGENHYVVAPPSIRLDRGRYVWVNPLKILPEAQLDSFLTSQTGPAKSPGGQNGVTVHTPPAAGV